MKENRKPLEQRTCYRIWKGIDNHTLIFLAILAILVTGILYLTFSILQRESYEIALKSYDSKQYEKMDDTVNENVQGGVLNIFNIPKDIKLSIRKEKFSDEIICTFSQELSDKKSWLVPNMDITIEMSRFGEILSKTSCYETKESYVQRVQEDYKWSTILFAVLGCILVEIVIVFCTLKLDFYWRVKISREKSREFSEHLKEKAVYNIIDMTSEI